MIYVWGPGTNHFGCVYLYNMMYLNCFERIGSDNRFVALSKMGLDMMHLL